MKYRCLALTAFTAFVVAVPPTLFAAGDHPVRGHVTKKGKYVAPTRATNPNSTQRDNYSSKPNVNPYSGKRGTHTPAK
jgi:hypothetical protein